jgi:hypothetical protein
METNLGQLSYMLLACRHFKTAGEFKLEALGDENHSVKYGYVLLRLKKQ